MYIMIIPFNDIEDICCCYGDICAVSFLIDLNDSKDSWFCEYNLFYIC